MAKIILYLVIGLISISCRIQLELPRDLYVDGGCTETEMISVFNAINEVTGIKFK